MHPPLGREQRGTVCFAPRPSLPCPGKAGGGWGPASAWLRLVNADIGPIAADNRFPPVGDLHSFLIPSLLLSFIEISQMRDASVLHGKGCLGTTRGCPPVASVALVFLKRKKSNSSKKPQLIVNLFVCSQVLSLFLVLRPKLCYRSCRYKLYLGSVVSSGLHWVAPAEIQPQPNPTLLPSCSSKEGRENPWGDHRKSRESWGHPLEQCPPFQGIQPCSPAPRGG